MIWGFLRPLVWAKSRFGDGPGYGHGFVGNGYGQGFGGYGFGDGYGGGDSYGDSYGYGNGDGGDS